jgi:hypothetical protein
MSETSIMKVIREAVCLSGRALITRNQVGFDGEHCVRYGLGIGSPDLVGVLIPSGIAFCIEVKTPKGRASVDQLAWWKAWRRRGVRGGFARSVGEAMELLNEAERT